MNPEMIVYRLMNAAQAAIIEESTNMIMEIQNNVRTKKAVRNETSTKAGATADAGQDGGGSEQPPVPPVL